MSARYPSTVQLSLEEFSRHGGLSGPHKDGCGIAWYDERDVRIAKEAFRAARSACVRDVQHGEAPAGLERLGDNVERQSANQIQDAFEEDHALAVQYLRRERPIDSITSRVRCRFMASAPSSLSRA